MRTETAYIDRNTKRDCDTAAKLLGLDCGDAFIELAVKEKLATMPEVEERGKDIKSAIKKISDAWQAKYLPKV